VKKKNLRWLSLLLVVAVSYAALNVTHAPPAPPLPNVYVDPGENVYSVGDVFTVDINIADVEDLYSCGIKISWKRDLLNCIGVTEGPFIKSTNPTAFVYVIHDDYVDAGVSTLGPYWGIWGSGTLMTLTFSVIDAGTTPLEIFYSVLIDHWTPGNEISHTVTDGYFETIQAATLVKKSAWPEHHHFDVSVQLANDGDSNQTLYALVANTSPVGYDLYAYVAFEIVRDDGVVFTPTSDVATVALGTQMLTADFPLTSSDRAKYYVTACCWYSYTGAAWSEGEKVKTFSFAVVP